MVAIMTGMHVDSPPTRRPVRQLLAASVGNAVEWYDWYAYTFLATYIADQVFPKSADNSLVPLLSTFAVFAVGFFMRPVGGLLMGVVADRRGRRAALTVTILLMGGSSLLVGLTPTYSAAGVLAPVILVAARLLQGLSWAASSRPRRPSWWSPRDPAGAGCSPASSTSPRRPGSSSRRAWRRCWSTR
ncbi:hypothetical protein GCM10010279_54300 [Streptomyces mutabilis]|nr:hypothetical protein GCM10010279_54300 [Streptomyces mutabilis]